MFRGWAYVCVGLSRTYRDSLVFPRRRIFRKYSSGSTVLGPRYLPTPRFPAPSARQSISWVSSMRYVKSLCAPPSVSQLVISRVLVFVDSKDCHGERRCGAFTRRRSKIAPDEEVRTKNMEHVIVLRLLPDPFVCFLTAPLPSCGPKVGMLLTRSTCVH